MFYLSGTMRFGRFDVTEGQMCVIAIMLASALFGPQLWSLNVRQLFNPNNIVYKLTMMNNIEHLRASVNIEIRSKQLFSLDF